MTTMVSTRLPIPGFFDSGRVGEIWQVPYLTRAQEAADWARRFGLKPAATDRTRVSLLLVDVQNTFCHPNGELSVAGAVEDNVRLCEFIYRNLGVISQIAPTMDTHVAMQIFHPVFWVNAQHHHPAPLTIISEGDVRNGVWVVNPAVAVALGSSYPLVQAYALHYTKKLAEGGKYPLIIWPYHAMLGGVGHALVPAVEEACFFHSVARVSLTRFEVKGGNNLTENYSVLRPEVSVDHRGDPVGQINTEFIKTLLGSDVVIIAGQAKSHCVAWTIADLLGEITTKDPALARKVYLLEDCTSPVVVPGIVDFTGEANKAFRNFADAGMHIVRSTEPIESWSGVSF